MGGRRVEIGGKQNMSTKRLERAGGEMLVINEASLMRNLRQLPSFNSVRGFPFRGVNLVGE